MILDLTPIRDKSGPARLLHMVEGRSKQAFQDWLADRHQEWLDRVEVVAMDCGFRAQGRATEELPDAVAVMDPFHAVRLARNALGECRRRAARAAERPADERADHPNVVQLALCGHRGREAVRTESKARVMLLIAVTLPMSPIFKRVSQAPKLRLRCDTRFTASLTGTRRVGHLHAVPLGAGMPVGSSYPVSYAGKFSRYSP